MSNEKLKKLAEAMRGLTASELVKLIPDLEAALKLIPGIVDIEIIVDIDANKVDQVLKQGE